MLKALRKFILGKSHCIQHCDDCKHTLSKLAQTNNATGMWVPGHRGIQGNDKAD